MGNELEFKDLKAIVTGAVTLSREIWTLAISAERRSSSSFLVLPSEEFADCLERAFPNNSRDFDGILKQSGAIFYPLDTPDVEVKKRLVQPHFCCNLLLGKDRANESDRRYWVARAICKHYNSTLTFGLRRILQTLTNTLNDYRENSSLTRENFIVHCKNDLLSRISCKETPALMEQVDRTLAFFLEGCRLAEYLYLDEELHPAFRPEQIDCEYLIACLFCCPVAIPGLNELFGGNGPLLLDPFFAKQQKEENDDLLGLKKAPMRARTMVIRGEIGCGKSLLSLQLSAEVAQKGGIAILFPLEQSPEECLYASQCAGLLQDVSLFSVCVGENEFEKAVEESEKDGRGVLAFLDLGPKNSITNFYLELAKYTNSFPSNRLNLIVVDPLNSIGIPPYQSRKTESFFVDSTSENIALKAQEIREQTLSLIKTFKNNGVNLALIIEDPHPESRGNSDIAAWTDDLSIAENLADTVILMRIKETHEYTQRKISIQKSRYQREQRGEHSFSIRPNKGILIYPSPAAVSVRIKNKKHIRPDSSQKTTFGHEGIDDILGESLYRGDVIAFTGAGGSFKTPLGCYYLKKGKENAKVISFLFATRDSEEPLSILDKRISDNSPDDSPAETKIISLPKGLLNPGMVLQIIEDTISRTRQNGYTVERVMIDDLDQWDMSSPLMQDDPTFGVTLVQLLRSLHVTALLVCGKIGNADDTPLQKCITQNADCLIEFERFEFRGGRHVTMRIAKSRGMKHRLGSYEIHGSHSEIYFTPSSSLLRICNTTGAVESVGVRLFLHAETEAQNQYYRSIESEIRSILSSTTQIDCQDRLHLNSTLGIGRYSAMDELQILQLDEYQRVLHTGTLHSKNFSLYEFHDLKNELDFWKDVGAHLHFLGFGQNDNEKNPPSSITAIPFYQNPSLLVRNVEEIPTPPTSWEELCKMCWEWEQANPIPNDKKIEDNNIPVFFDFPKISCENYNCLFLEILLSHIPGELPPSGSTSYDLLEWLKRPEAPKALRIFRQLAQRSYRCSLHTLTSQKETNLTIPDRVNTNAQIWRHWYSGIGQMLEHIKRSSMSLAISPLPGDIAISGDWYLALPAYSAAPRVGLEIIKLMTSRTSELHRLEKGIGLPTRDSFYLESTEKGHADACQIKSNTYSNFLPLPGLSKKKCLELMKKSFRRSSIKGYHDLSTIMAAHLIQILKTTLYENEYESFDCYEKKCAEIENFCKIILNDMANQFAYIRKGTETM